MSDESPASGEPPASSRPTVRRGVGAQFAWVSGGRLIATLLQAVLLVLAARSMDPGTFGLLMALSGVILLTQVLFDAGVGTFTSRERASAPASGGVTTALRFLSVSSTGLVLAVATLVSAAALLISDDFWLMLPLALWAAGERNADMRLTVAFADGDTHVVVTNLVLRRLGSVLGFSVLLRAEVTPLLAFSLATAATATASATFAYLYVRPRVTAPASLTFRALLRESRPFWVASIALQARQLDAMLVAAVAGAGQAGVYAGGSRLVNPLQILATSMAAVLLPTSARAQRTRARLRRLVRLALLVVAALSLVYLVLFLGAGLFVNRILGPEYDGTATVIRIILLGLPFSAAGALFSAILQGQGRAHRVAVASSTSTGFTLIGIPIAATQAGATAAAGVLAASFVVQCALLSRALLAFYRDLPETTGAHASACSTEGIGAQAATSRHRAGVASDGVPIAAIAFTPGAPDQSPNVRRTTVEGMTDTYYRSMVVAFASYGRWCREARLVLITDADVPAAYAPHLEALGVEVRDVAFDHRPPPGFSNRFTAALYSLDALSSLCEEPDEVPIALLDPDCLAVGPLAPLFDRARGGVCAYPMALPPDFASNGLSARDAEVLHHQLDPELTGLPTSYGGECYAFTPRAMRPLLARAVQAYRFTLDRSPTEPRITTEEQALDYALRYAEVEAVDDLVRRIWTAPTRRNVVGDEADLTLWHLPAEKDRGIADLLEAATSASSWFWTTGREDFVARLGRHVGVTDVSPSRRFYDTTGRVVRRLQRRRPARPV